jgi:hypothetical protein
MKANVIEVLDKWNSGPVAHIATVISFSSKQPKICIGEKILFSINDAGKTAYPLVKD